MSEPKYVKWIIFCWAVGILTTLIIFTFGIASSAKIDTSELRANYKGIDTDIEWIKSTLTKIEGKLK